MLIKTTGSFMLIDPTNGAEIEPETETEVILTGFIQDRLDSGQLIEVAPAKPAKATAK